MTENKIEKEIEISVKRIETRQNEIDSELTVLSKQIKKYTNWAWTFVIGGGLIGVLSIFWYLCKNEETGFGINQLGDFMSGTVAALWSLAGLFFIYIAFLGQKQQILNQQLEIMYSQLEVKYTRLELAGQKAEMKEQNSTLKQQRFENTFFQLISLFNSIVNSLDLRNSTTKAVTTTGRECLNVFYKRLRKHLTEIVHGRSSSNDNLSSATINQTLKAFSRLYENEKADLSHYYRTIYRIFKFIDNSDIEDKKQYAAIARAQLSSYEQILIFYNCLHIHGREKFKPLVEKFAIFKNLDDSLLINERDRSEYEISAYGE
ncbi:MAG: putative phage abortive infection protein [Daejeonella sp.]|uniref:putative phage abortive infection protein n=1 Tax=Daejeonella sp. TaxID=2805397 RepID=UPI0027338F3E|nr:putative phage abortive infection protein [Daejeonella sp.]MDP3470220.1 putative phage abortive infection protein [Daejeonella sp.]